MSEINHKLAAIVFTDIVGYTKQMEEDEQRTLLLLQKQRDIISPIVKSFEGEIIKELGDGLLMMFSSAVNAVRCAISVQTRLHDEDLTIRAGIHIGEVIFKDGDVFGSAVNMAARIQPLASANGVCISDAVKKQVQNQTDIKVHSIGVKELKGIKDPVEIFEVLIEGVTQAKKKDIKFLYSDLWSRRVIHVMAMYLVGAWIMKMVISYIVNYTMRSPHLVDLAWVILLSLLPTVFLLTYYHGYRSSGKWTKAELIGFPSNAVFSILLIIFLFNGKDLGAATTTVSIVDENGKKIERTIVKNEFRKKTLIFFFENNSGDKSLNWMQYALPNLIEYDASQDMYLEVYGAGNYIYKFRDKGIKNEIETSLGQKKKISDDLHRSTFLTGTFNFFDGKYTVTTKLFNAETVRVLSENQFTGKDIFRIVDEISVKLKKDLEIPVSQIENTADMPVSEIYTSSFKALEYFTKGYREAAINNNWANGVQLLEHAINEDKEFVFAYQYLSFAYFYNNQVENARKSIKVVVDSKDRIPQRYQFWPQYIYHLIHEEPEKAVGVCMTWAEFFPDDINAYVALLRVYANRNDLEMEVKVCKAILKLDSLSADALNFIGHLYMQKEDYDSAAYYFNLYTERFPNDYKAVVDLGKLYLRKADFVNAKQIFEKASFLEPGNVEVLCLIAEVELREGSFDKAAFRYNEALGSSKSAKDSASVYDYFESYYDLKGEMTTALEFYKMSYNKAVKFQLPVQLLLAPVYNVEAYVLAGKSKEILELLKSSEKKLQPPLNKYVSLGYLNYYIEMGNPVEAEKYISGAEDAITIFTGEKVSEDIFYARARIAEIRKAYKVALVNYKKYKELRPSSYIADRLISRCLRELGNLRESRMSIEKALKRHPYDPKSNYEAAILCIKLNEKKKAKEYLDRALKIWKDADTNYEPYRKALVAQRQLGAV